MNDFMMYKCGMLSFHLTSLDASHTGQTAFCPSFETMTVGLKLTTMRPIFVFGFLQDLSSFSGPRSRLSHQSRQSIICVKGIKRGGYKTFGAKNPLNPNEKPKRANGWVISTWTNPGRDLFVHHCLGNTVVSCVEALEV